MDSIIQTMRGVQFASNTKVSMDEVQQNLTYQLFSCSDYFVKIFISFWGALNRTAYHFH